MSRLRAQAAELVRFGLVGGSAVAVDFCVYFALVGLNPLFPTTIAKGVSFVTGAVLAFLLNRGFVFRAEGTASRQVVPFAVLYLVSLGLNTSVNAVILSAGAVKSLAWLGATATSTISNFLGMKFIVFRKKSESARARARARGELP